MANTVTTSTMSPASPAWTVDRIVPLLAGVMIALSLALAISLSQWWLVLTAFVAANLVFYGIVGWCPASLIMRRAGIPAAGACAAR
ncbi:YgaP family membrane protein [Lolliginicoccus suaedae]|uniref:YgaP family membrane protein n=1 Tax=Lolliginicoccus suaedae TaxID=2605429 RepID=UPI001F2053D0|nr:DUF2892 domain-containing protein [Lolliginicoccus suaedae]